MSLLNRYLGDAYITWLASVTSCCGAQLKEEPLRGEVKPMRILHIDQPQLIPPPIPEPQHARSTSHEWMSRTRSLASRISTRESFSIRSRTNAYSALRRPQIGAPTDFRHVERALPRGSQRFRPLELSIYMPENRLAPLSLPQYGIEEDEEPILAYPEPVAIAHSRSESAMSHFSIPRKPLRSHPSCHLRGERPSIDTRMSSDTAWASEALGPRPGLRKSLSTQELQAALERDVPVSPPQARLRSFSEAPYPTQRPDSQLDRVKLVIQEKLILEQRLKELDNIIEDRQSTYARSRANSLFSIAEKPRADSVASERKTFDRPSTAPVKPTVRIPHRAKSFSEISATFNAIEEDMPLPPPLPLVLERSTPPLRKKKSFSRVSSWLFPDQARNVSVESVTNTPKPVTSREGFYKCIDPSLTTTRRSSVSTVSTMVSTTGDGPNATADSATWTSDSSPQARTLNQSLQLHGKEVNGEKEKFGAIVVTREFGTKSLRLSKVGMAF